MDKYQDEQQVIDPDEQYKDRKVISFRGKLSEESKQYLNKQQSKMGVVTALIIIAVFAIPSIAMLFLDNPQWFWALFILGGGGFGGVLFGLMMAFVRMYPDRIDIENNIIYLVNDSGKFNISQGIENVKMVIDMGNFYYIKFFAGRFPCRLCQKDLLVSGTIEDFEEVFKGLIVRR